MKIEHFGVLHGLAGLEERPVPTCASLPTAAGLERGLRDNKWLTLVPEDRALRRGRRLGRSKHLLPTSRKDIIKL